MGNRDYPERPEHTRVVSRLDKKIHLQTLISEKEGFEFWRRFKDSARRDLLKQYLIPFLENYKRYNADKECYDPFFNTEEFFNGFEDKIRKMIRLTGKIIHSLSKNQEEELKERDLQRLCSKRKPDLCPALDFLAKKKIIIWNKSKKVVSLHPDYINQLESFSKRPKGQSSTGLPVGERVGGDMVRWASGNSIFRT